jgi:hypothetical protein
MGDQHTHRWRQRCSCGAVSITPVRFVAGGFGGDRRTSLLARIISVLRRAK